MTEKCRLCHSDKLHPMVNFGQRPIAHRLLMAADEAEDTFPIQLHCCDNCGLVQIIEPIDPEILYKNFNYNFSSWKNEPHIPSEIAMIMNQGPYTSVMEIGCNDGRFLDLLKTAGIPKAAGIEPNNVSSAQARERGFTVYHSWITPEICTQAVSDNGRPFDLILSRQVIEHVLDLDNFFHCIKLMLSDDGILFLDMPDFEVALRTGDCSAVWEEHVSYFTQATLDYMLARHGFDVIHHQYFDFSSGALSVVARRAKANARSAPLTTKNAEIVALAHRYNETLNNYKEALFSALKRAKNNGYTVVLYGVGVRGCCLTNGIGIGPYLDYAIDDQVERQGKFMPGSRTPIRTSAVLNDETSPIILLLAVNNENEDAIRCRINKENIYFITLCSPKDILGAISEIPK